MSKSKGVRLNSGLGKAAAEYSNKCGPTKSYTAAFGDGAKHLADIARNWYDATDFKDIRDAAGVVQLLNYLGSYCGRE